VPLAHTFLKFPFSPFPWFPQAGGKVVAAGMTILVIIY